MEELGRPIDEHDLDAFESRFQVRLPADYRRWMLAHNGMIYGDPGDPCTFTYPDVTPDSRIRAEHGTGDAIHIMLSIRPKHQPDHSRFDARGFPENDLTIDYTWPWMKVRYPLGTMPVADCGCGNTVLMRLSPDAFGEIILFDHELEGEPNDGHLVWLAHSFDEFLTMLHPFDPNED